MGETAIEIHRFRKGHCVVGYNASYGQVLLCIETVSKTLDRAKVVGYPIYEFSLVVYVLCPK